jgi:hypothetical protein
LIWRLLNSQKWIMLWYDWFSYRIGWIIDFFKNDLFDSVCRGCNLSDGIRWGLKSKITLLLIVVRNINSKWYRINRYTFHSKTITTIILFPGTRLKLKNRSLLSWFYKIWRTLSTVNIFHWVHFIRSSVRWMQCNPVADLPTILFF